MAAVAAALLPAGPAAGAWGPPVPVSRDDGASYRAPHAALGARGAAMAAWIRVPPGTPRGPGAVEVAERAGPGASWGRRTRLSGLGAGRPRTALNARGDAVVVWTAGRRVVGASRRGPSGPWRRALVAETVGAVRDIVVSLDPRGRATVLWSESRGTAALMRVAVRTRPAGPWRVRPPRVASGGPAYPALALSPSRGALVAWTERARVRVARTVAGRFERPVELSARGTGAPAVALAPAGSGLAAWAVRLPGGTPVLMAAVRASADSRWGVSEDLGIGTGPVAAMAAGGGAAVVWGSGDPGEVQGVEAAVRRPGGRWESGTVVPQTECSCTMRATGVTMHPGGTVAASWHRREASNDDVGGVGVRAPGARSWSRASVTLGGGPVPPHVVAGPGGTALAVWADEEGSGPVRAISHSARSGLLVVGRGR